MLFSVKQSCTFKIYAITRCSFLYIVICIMELAYSNTSRPTSDTAYLLTFIDFSPSFAMWLLRYSLKADLLH